VPRVAGRGRAVTAPETEALAGDGGAVIRGFAVEVIDGGTRGRRWDGGTERCAIGAAPTNDLVIDEPTVSRFHCELCADDRGVTVRDLDSKNGTSVDGVSVGSARVRDGSVVRCGRVALRVLLGDRAVHRPRSERTSFGGLRGAAPAMRAAFALLERAAASDVTVLLEGETGTGKDGAARALHAEGPRRTGPFVVVDCGAISPTLIESELFGHERGAFTGAVDSRRGVFEAARGGTVFLDEIGELPLELQPKLLRALEAREVRRLGASAAVPIDVRVIAATHRDLRAEINAGSFRADLYYRLAVVRIELPPLRQRLDDLPLLIDGIVADLVAGGLAPAIATALRAPPFASELATAAWPGNVRELRNHLAMCGVLGAATLPTADAGRRPAALAVDLTVPLKEARQRLLDDFEQRYLEALLERHDGNVSAAARQAGLSRVSLYALLRKAGLR